MTPATRGMSTSHQRLYIRTMLRQLELPTDFITLQHRRLFEFAKLGMSELDRPLEPTLCSLTHEQASALIRVLKEETDGLS